MWGCHPIGPRTLLHRIPLRKSLFAKILQRTKHRKDWAWCDKSNVSFAHSQVYWVTSTSSSPSILLPSASTQLSSLYVQSSGNSVLGTEMLNSACVINAIWSGELKVTVPPEINLSPHFGNRTYSLPYPRIKENDFAFEPGPGKGTFIKYPSSAIQAFKSWESYYCPFSSMLEK